MTALRPLPVCPFCKGTITIDLLRAGGNCSHCMLEIPGEEAPTDPGLEMRKKQEGIAASQARTRRTLGRILGFLLTGVFLVVGGVSYWYVQRQLDELVYDLDEVYIPPRDRLLAAAPKAQPEPEALAKAPSGSARAPRLPSEPVELALTAAAKVAASSSTPATVKYVPPSKNGDAAVGLSAGPETSVGLGGADIAVFRVGDDVITDDEAIFRMAKGAIGAYGPQMETCAAQRMKQDESFAGAWKLQLTIQKAGTVSKVKITPTGKSDSELEGCMQRAAASWQFAKIAHDFTFSKTYRFSAAEF